MESTSNELEKRFSIRSRASKLKVSNMEKPAGGRSDKFMGGYSSSHTRTKKKGPPKSSASSRHAKPRPVNVVLMKGRPEFDDEMRRQLAVIDALPDDQIDTSDLPELTDEQLRNRTVYINLVPVPGTRKKSVTIRLDEDLVKWFK